MKELTDVEKEEAGYAFECWWDGSLDIEEELERARESCGVRFFSELRVTPSSNLAHPNALVSAGLGSDEVKSLRQLMCVRSHLLNHGWTKRLTTADPPDWQI